MSNAAVFSILVAIGLLTNCGSTFDMTVNIGVEQSQYTGFLRTRQDGKKVVYLKENGHIRKDFEIFSNCFFSNVSVFYSNDGRSDSMNITLDGGAVGFFTTKPPTTDDLPSEMWNVQQNSGPLGGRVSVELRPGSHTLVLTVTRTDCNGLEIGDITLHLACENSPTSSTSSTTSFLATTTSTFSASSPTSSQNSATFTYTTSPPSFFTTTTGIVLIAILVFIIVVLVLIAGAGIVFCLNC